MINLPAAAPQQTPVILSLLQRSRPSSSRDLTDLQIPYFKQSNSQLRTLEEESQSIAKKTDSEFVESVQQASITAPAQVFRKSSFELTQDEPSPTLKVVSKMSRLRKSRKNIDFVSVRSSDNSPLAAKEPDEGIRSKYQSHEEQKTVKPPSSSEQTESKKTKVNLNISVEMSNVVDYELQLNDFSVLNPEIKTLLQRSLSPNAAKAYNFDFISMENAKSQFDESHEDDLA